MRWLRQALEEARKLDDVLHVRDVFAAFYGSAGQSNCGEHGDGDEICCGNELMRRYIDGFGEPLRPEEIPYDENPNAPADEEAIKGFFSGTREAPKNIAIVRVKRGDHPIGRYLKAKAEKEKAEAAARG